LVVQDVATVGAAPRPRALMNNSVDRAAAQVLIMLLVNQYADRQLVDGWNLKRLPRCDLGTAESGGRSGSGDRCRTFQEISTFEIVHVGPSMLKREGQVCQFQRDNDVQAPASIKVRLVVLKDGRPKAQDLLNSAQTNGRLAQTANCLREALGRRGLWDEEIRLRLKSESPANVYVGPGCGRLLGFRRPGA